MYKFKNRNRRHTWLNLGLLEEGIVPTELARMQIKCTTCGERRKVWRGISLHNVVVVQGCVRYTIFNFFRPGDLVVVDGRIDEIVFSNPFTGLVKTFNAGGLYFKQHKTKVQRYHDY